MNQIYLGIAAGRESSLAASPDPSAKALVDAVMPLADLLLLTNTGSLTGKDCEQIAMVFERAKYNHTPAKDIAREILPLVEHIEGMHQGTPEAKDVTRIRVAVEQAVAGTIGMKAPLDLE